MESTGLLYVVIPATATVVTAWLNNRRTKKVEDRVNHEFTNNGGGSARDLLDYVVLKVDKIDSKLDNHIRNHG